DEKSYQWYDDYGEGYSQYGYIVGHMNALDAPGEWILEDGMMHLIFPEGKNPDNCRVEAKSRQLVVDLDNRQFINVEGFRTIGGSARMNNSVMCKLDNMDMNYISHTIHIADQHAGYIDFDLSSKLNANGDYQTVLRTANGSPERGESGVYIGGRDNMFVNSKINNSALTALYITGLYAYIDNNYMNDVGYQGNYASGISFYPKAYDNSLTGGHFVYNNTVYNCGRSNINIGRIGGMTPYVPCDIGYNDFHDGILTSADTGITYQYYVNMGYDGIMSSEHHNYIYMTTNEKDYNPYSNGIYHDGGSFGLDSFKNQVFFTKPKAGFSGHYVFEQSAPQAPANYLIWDNYKTGYIEGGVDALEAGYFAEDKPYFAGCLDGVEYTKNYDRFKAGVYGMQKTARDGEFSDGITLDEESGYAAFSANDQYIKFTDVDFGEGANQIVLSARGDSAHTSDKLEIIIGDSIKTGAKYEMEAKLNAPDRDIPNRLSRTIRPMRGNQTVFIKVTDYRSLEIGGLSAINVGSGTDSDEYSLYLYAGNFQEWVKFDAGADTFSPPTAKYTNAVDPGAGFLNNTWPGYYIKYEQQEFSAPTDTFMIIGGSGGDYAHQPIEIYIDGVKESNMVTKFNLAGDSWSYATPQLYKLNRVIPAGVHDVYMKFATDDGYNKSADMKYIGFVKEGVTLREFKQVKVKVYGGEFDKTISKASAGYPFRAELMNPPNYTNPGLTYALPGSVAGYKNINIGIDATKFVISYATEPGIDGETIDVHIGSPDSAPIATLVTEGKGLLNFTDVTIDLKKPLPKGQYDVYLSFSGGNGEKLNTKIDWFGFND
ncbi:MAG: carbohydrate-binding protein, partial [Clostridia bacterium]|nr:carbohydrate-binding protein [Clostridia bacterium]